MDWLIMQTQFRLKSQKIYQFKRKKMLKKIFCIVAVFFSLLVFGQSKEVKNYNPYRKGAVFLFWGWNRAWYSNSDIRFKGTNYDFTLNNVQATDRPTDFSFRDYFHPLRVTIPQTNARMGYFLKDNFALVLGLDHMKYVMKQNQKVSYTIYNPYQEQGQMDLSNGDFLTYEHTDGLNYINLGVEKYIGLLKNQNLNIALDYGAGAGILYPKSNIKLKNNERSDRFHLAGLGLDTRLGLNMIFFKHIMARVEAKYGYINMPDIKSTHNPRDKASQDFVFGQINFGIGYIFNTRK